MTPTFTEDQLKHIHKYPNEVGIDCNEVHFLPGILEDFVTGNYYEDDNK